MMKLEKVFICDVTRVSWSPVDAVEESRYVGKILLGEVALIIRRILVEVLSIIGFVRVNWLHTIFSININQVDCLLMLLVISIFPDRFNLIRSDSSNRQFIQNLEASLGNSSPTSHSKDHWRQLLWNFSLFHVLANFA